MDETPQTFRPQPGPQEAWLSSAADIAVLGGSAGGGKTWSLVYEALRHVANPNFGAVIFRRTCPQITNEGGLWDEAGKIYPLAGARPNQSTLDWIFPSGANVGFRHLQHESNKYDWQGTQIPMLGLDELPHFTESQFWYMLSRNRSTCGVRPYVRATCNPDPGWVKRLLAPWVDRKFPDPARSGEVRWFCRIKGVIVWGRSPEDLERDYPGSYPKSITFVRASIFDNKVLLEKDPGYLANLHALPPVERARLLDGDWDVVNEGLVYPEFGTCVVEAEHWPEALAGRRYGGIDWGWNNPFGALEAVLDRDDVLWVRWERWGSKITLTEHSKAIPRGRPGEPEDAIRWYADPAGADQIGEFRVAGHDVVPCVHTGQKPLESGIALVTERMRTRRLWVHGSLGHVIEEAGKYRYEKQTERPVDADNHLLAALRYLVVGIDRGKAVRDEAPRIPAEVLEAREKAEREKRVTEYRNPDAEHWWGGD